MRPILLALSVLCLLVLSGIEASARCRSCANGQCARPAATATAQPHAPAGGVDIDGKHYEGGQFIPTDKKSCAADASLAGSAEKRNGPVRGALKRVGKVALAPLRFLKRHHGQRLFHRRGC